MLETAATIVLGLVAVVILLWIVAAVAGALWVRRQKKKMDEKFERDEFVLDGFND